MKSLAAIASVALLSAPAAGFAAPVPAWTVDKAASSLRFSSSLGGEAFSGAFKQWDADIRFDPANLAGSSVAATVNVASAGTGSTDRDQALPTADFFDAAHFPKATFVAKSFKALGGGRYQAAGVLTLRGVAKPLTLPFTLAITGPQAKMTGAVAINRLAFGVGQNEWKAVTTLPAAVSVTLNLVARKK
jgi:polyisoprenoid-binding protein YceI